MGRVADMARPLPAAVALALAAAPFAAAAAALPPDLRWACLPFVSCATCPLSPSLGGGRPVDSPRMLAALSLLALVASLGGGDTMPGVALLCWGVAMGAHAALRAMPARVGGRW